MTMIMMIMTMSETAQAIGWLEERDHSGHRVAGRARLLRPYGGLKSETTQAIWWLEERDQSGHMVA